MLYADVDNESCIRAFEVGFNGRASNKTARIAGSR